MSQAVNKGRAMYGKWFFFTIMYLVVDYGRPQDVLHMDFLKPGMVFIVALAAFLLFSGKIGETFNKQTMMIWLFIALLAIYVPFARNNYFAYIATKDMLLFMPFILSVTICVNSMERLKKLIFVCVCIMIYITAYSLLHHGTGSGNYFADENDVSLYINMWIPFCFFLLLATKDKLEKLLYLAGLAMGIGAVVISFSRGGFVGLVVVSVVCWLSSTKKILSAVMISLLIFIVMIFASDAYWQRISTSTDTDQGTAAERIESWKAGWNMFLSNPWGVGGNNFQVRFYDYQSDYFKKGMWGRVAHSLWFTLFPELGIAGIIIYFLLLKYNLADIIYLKRLNRQKEYSNPDLQYLHALSGAFLASLAGFFSSGTFLSVLYYPHYWYMTGIIAATTKIAKNMRDTEVLMQDAGAMNLQSRSIS